MVLLHPLRMTKIQLKALVFPIENSDHHRKITHNFFFFFFFKGESQILVGHSVLEKPTLKIQIFYFLGLSAITSLGGTWKPCTFGPDTPSLGTAGVCCTSGLCW